MARQFAPRAVITGEAGVGQSALGLGCATSGLKSWPIVFAASATAITWIPVRHCSPLLISSYSASGLSDRLNPWQPTKPRLNRSAHRSSIVYSGVSTMLYHSPTSPKFLFIDALDEATRNGRNQLASLIGAEFQRYHRRFWVIMTASYEQEINLRFRH